jgi:VanZ family protein
MGRRNVLIFRILLGVLFIVISYLAFTPLKFPIIERIWDKADHAAAFLTLALATDFSFPDSKYGWPKILPLLGYGLMIEIVQRHLPYRQFDLLDVVADVVGLSLYAATLPLMRRIPVLKRRWSQPSANPRVPAAP